MMNDEPSPPAQDEQEAIVLTGLLRWSEMLIAAALIIIGIVILVQTQDIRVVRAMSQVTPRAIPNVVGGGLIAVGLWYAIDIIRQPRAITAGEDDEDVDIGAPTEWGVLAIIAIALAIFALLIRPAGFIIASAVLFGISSTGMGSRNILANGVIGIVISSVVYAIFDVWLGVRLPDGILEPILN